MYQRLFAWNAGNRGISGRFLRSWLPYKYRLLISKVLSRPLKVAGNRASSVPYVYRMACPFSRASRSFGCRCAGVLAPGNHEPTRQRPHDFD